MTQVVVGGGFRGVCLAAALRRRGADVLLIEAGRGLGGVLRGADWEGLPADLGCHLFTGGATSLERMLHDVLEGAVADVQVSYATMTPTGRVDGVAVLDLTGLADRDTASAELLAAAARDDEHLASDLRDRLLRRYGATAGLAAISAAERCARVPAHTLAPGALDSLPLGRIRLLPTPEALALKRDPRVDGRLAVPAADRPTATNMVAQYPRSGGLRAFADGLRSWLERLGVRVRTGAAIEAIELGGARLVLRDGEPIHAGHVWWTTAPEALAALLHDDPDALRGQPVPMVVHHFAVPMQQIGPFTYIHDFRPGRRVYRASTPGVYGGLVNAHGEGQVCAEVPCGLAEQAWTEAEAPDEADRVWSELVSMGIVAGATPQRHRALKAAASLNYPRKGASAAFAEFTARLAAHTPRITAWSQGTYAKAALIDEAEALAEAAAQGAG
jgi:glycine/D-amino acid oxidase-like deaminating enzyme